MYTQYIQAMTKKHTTSQLCLPIPIPSTKSKKDNKGSHMPHIITHNFNHQVLNNNLLVRIQVIEITYQVAIYISQNLSKALSKQQWWTKRSFKSITPHVDLQHFNFQEDNIIKYTLQSRSLHRPREQNIIWKSKQPLWWRGLLGTPSSFDHRPR